jgi:hypothetical protein
MISFTGKSEHSLKFIFYGKYISESSVKAFGKEKN